MEILQPIIENFKNARILCLGDVMLDRYVYGSVERISPEAPVPVFHIQRQIQMLGGVGNVVRNIAALGGQTRLISVVGQDETAETIRQECAKLSGLTAELVGETGRKSTLKTRFVSSGHQMLRADDEDASPLLPETEEKIFQLFDKIIKDYDVVVVSDYGKGFFSKALTQKILTYAKECKVPTVVDPKARDFSKYANAFIITPNFKEFTSACGNDPKTDDEIALSAQNLGERCSIENFLITRSQDGMSLCQKGQLPVHIPTQAREVFDVSGAGDTVVATLALGIASHTSLEHAARLANISAGVVVAKIGTATLTQDELIQAIENQGPTFDTAEIVSWERAQERVLEWHRQGFKVGFTNGCYDILHTGHLSLLKQSKEACDKLIVAVNSDASVKRLKGDSRPINIQDHRAQMLAALHVVDMVVIFEQDTPLELLTFIKPDVLIKGADYSLDQVVGAREVQSWGGKVVLADLVPGQSTTNILKRAS